jgi:hypothetical protein
MFTDVVVKSSASRPLFGAMRYFFRSLNPEDRRETFLPPSPGVINAPVGDVKIAAGR